MLVFERGGDSTRKELEGSRDKLESLKFPLGLKSSKDGFFHVVAGLNYFFFIAYAIWSARW